MFTQCSVKKKIQFCIDFYLVKKLNKKLNIINFIFQAFLTLILIGPMMLINNMHVFSKYSFIANFLVFITIISVIVYDFINLR